MIKIFIHKFEKNNINYCPHLVLVQYLNSIIIQFTYYLLEGTFSAVNGTADPQRNSASSHLWSDSQGKNATNVK